MRLEDLARTPAGGLKWKDIMRDLRDAYGKPGPEGWSLTDVIRMDRRSRTRILDLLGGIMRGKAGAAAPYPGRFRLKTLDGQPLEITKVRPVDPPEIAAEGGVWHHAPGQWEPQTWVMASEVDVALADEHDLANSATWLLLHYGHSAREGGSSKRRWGDKKARTAKRPPEEWLDRWTIVEEAFQNRHPEVFRAEGKGKQPAARAA